MQVQHV